MKVGIIFGSASDTDVMRGAARCLEEFDITYEAHILSAHRVPERLEEVLSGLLEDNCKVIIAGAGLAAHLPGVIASKVDIPVIGVPIKANLDGMDSLLSIVQMPKPIPVATVGINNSFNAGMLAVEILSLLDNNIKNKLKDYRINMKKTFIANNNQKISL